MRHHLLASVLIVGAVLLAGSFFILGHYETAPRPTAVILDFGSGNFINATFSERFTKAITNASLLHPSVLIVKIDSDGGAGYQLNGKEWIWMPQVVGEELRLFSDATNAKTFWYVPHECISGCYVASLYAQHVVTGPLANYTFGHDLNSLTTTTASWYRSVQSQTHPIDYSLNQAIPPFLDQFTDYDVVTIRA